MTWFWLSILVGLFFATSKMFARVALKGENDALAFTAVHSGIAGIVLLPLIVVNMHFPIQPLTWLFFGIMVSLSFLSDWSSFKALQTTDVSLYQIVNQVGLVLALLGGLLFFAELLTANKVVAIILITLGVIVALYEHQHLAWNIGIRWTVVSTVTSVLASMGSKRTLYDFSEFAFAAVEMFSIGMLCLVCMRRTSAVRIVQVFRRQPFAIVCSGILFAAMEVTYFYALSLGEASKVIPLTKTGLVFSLLGGIFLLGERQHLNKKISGTILILLGVLLLYPF